MASRGKKKTTMAKLNRETKLRERRQIKEARKEARERARLEPPVDETQEELEGQGEDGERDEQRGEAELAPPADSVTTDA
ncbi:MAG TPA: hypothetical protein VHX66_14005 [Solirubrobacteraceae bacterium]|jgi:hypothetical protein|nr:hypothetical protein [Solirubrobacteraceae bacterium]